MVWVPIAIGTTQGYSVNTFSFYKKNPPTFLSGFLWCGAGLNRRHKDFQSFALPTELPHHTNIEQGTRNVQYRIRGAKVRKIPSSKKKKATKSYTLPSLPFGGRFRGGPNSHTHTKTLSASASTAPS